MANYVRCELIAKNCGKGRFEQICEFVKSEKTLFDPEKILPTPKDLEIDEGSANNVFKNFFQKYSSEAKHPFCEAFSTDESEVLDILPNITDKELKSIRIHSRDYRCENDKDKIPAKEAVEEAIRLGWQYLYNKVTYFSETWYSWSIGHWGTKWIADVVMMEDELGWRLNTAWSAPDELIKVLSVIFPEVIFELRYADEDLGYNCGVMQFRDGMYMRMEVPTGNGDELSVEFARQLWGDED